MKKYYLHDGISGIGPFDKEELKQRGVVKTTPVWVEGKERWTCAENYEELHDLFFTIPPPIKLQYKPKKKNSWSQIIVKWAFALFVVSCITALIIVTLNEVDKEKEQLRKQEVALQTRNTITSLVTANTNQYTIHGWGGISNLDIRVTNNSNFSLDEVMVEVAYIKKNGGVFNVERLEIKNIGPNDTKSVSAPDCNRGKTVQVNINSIKSKQLNLCYDKNQPIIPGNPDPFLCKTNE
nr:DUF4339 domain-containing protein [uncultured Flavobacterium sp.]